MLVRCDECRITVVDTNNAKRVNVNGPVFYCADCYYQDTPLTETTIAGFLPAKGVN